MRTSLALIRTELVLLRRNTTAWATAVAVPFLIGALWALNEPPLGEGYAAAAVAQVMLLLVFTLHTVGTMTLAGRREQLVLKRWRSSQASATSVLAGSIGMLAGLVVLQAAVLTWLTARVAGQTPASVGMLVVGVLAGVAVVGSLTLLVAAFTRSAEHAMITTFPVITLLMVGSVWALMQPAGDVAWPVLAVPGIASIELLRLGWDGPVGGAGLAWLTEAAPALVATVALTIAASVAAARWFRWEPRD